jgi:hypothetical protein
LNVGGEAGVVVLEALFHIPDLVAMAQHSRSDLARVTEGLAARNGLMDSSRLKVTDGPLVFKSDGADEATGFFAYVNDFRPTVLRVCDRDITPGVLAQLNQRTLRRIILPLELLTDDTPAEAYTDALAKVGFGVNEEWQDRGMLVFYRNTALTEI